MSLPRQSVTHLPLEALVPHPANVREDLGDLDDLALSIREQGIVQPLVVTEHPEAPGAFLILAGHRRHAAARLAGLPAVPAVIRHDVTDEAEHIALMLVENLQRSNLGPVEKAEAIGALANRGLTQTDIARVIGIAQSSVNYYLSLLELDDESLEQIKAGDLGVGQAREIVREQRAAERAVSGEKKRGQPLHVEPPHFTSKHPLAGLVDRGCDHTDRPRVGTVGCGQCWETWIREDALGNVDHDGLPQPRTTGEKALDEVAIQRAVNGDRSVTLNLAEVREAVRLLHGRGLSDVAIGKILGRMPKSIHRTRSQQLGLPPVPEHAAKAGLA